MPEDSVTPGTKSLELGDAPEEEDIPVFRPSFDEREEEAACKVLRTGWLGFGPCVGKFEQEFSRFVGSPWTIGTASGTWALRLALRTLAVRGREVITTPLSFVATAQAILAEGGLPVFADVDSRGLLDPFAVRALLRDQTAAVLPVHLGGFAASPAEFSKLCNEAGVALLEDCAHAAGARYQGRHLGTFGLAGAFSFHAVKPLAMGEGGAVVTRDSSLAHLTARLRWFGIDRDTFERSEDRTGDRWRYQIEELGEKAYLDNLHAALGLVQLSKLVALRERRAEIAARYQADLEGVGDLELPRPCEGEEPSWHLFMVQTKERDELARHLAGLGIMTGVHYPLITEFNALRYLARSTPKASELSRRLLTLPLYSGMTGRDIDRVISGVRSHF